MMFPIVSRWGCLISSLLLLAAALSSCADVKSEKVIGTNVPANLKAFEGTWVPDTRGDLPANTPEAITIQVKDAAAGLLEVTMVNPKKDGSPDTMLCNVRTLHNHTFVNLSLDKSSYDFALLTAVGKQTIVVVAPNVDTFARLVDSGVLRGKVDYKADHKPATVTLEGLTEAENARLFSGEYGECFGWEHPLVLMRVPKP